MITKHYQYYIKQFIAYWYYLDKNSFKIQWMTPIELLVYITTTLSKTLICHCKCYNVMQCAMWISRFNIYLWSKVVLFCFVLSHWDLPNHNTSCHALGIFERSRWIWVHWLGFKRILGVPVGFQDFATHFLDDVLFQDVAHIDDFPLLGDAQVALGILASSVTYLPLYLT